MTEPRICAAFSCGKILPPNRRRFCSDTCQQRSSAQKYRAGKAGGKAPVKEIEAVRHLQPRRGPLYDKFVNMPEVSGAVLAGVMSMRDASDFLETSPTNVGRLVAALKEDLALEQKRQLWSLSDDAQSLLGPPDDEVPDRGTPEFDIFLDQMVAAFSGWRTRFFEDEDGHDYLVPDFQRRWIKAILRAIYNGSRLQILSPPRHGKSQLLIHFCIWEIVRNPNVRVGWIASNTDMAVRWLASIKQEFETNGPLRAAYLPPGVDWKPTRGSGKFWANDQITIATRTRVLKTPTMIALGRGSRVLSLDFDFIICDDIEDDESTAQPTPRERTRIWMAQTVGSRKMRRTGFVYIGSRQDPDDLSHYLIEDEGWESIVEQAHDPMCDLSTEDPTVHADCMLFPQINDYKWFREIERDFENKSLGARFQMVYQNIVSADQLAKTFDIEEMKRCRSLRKIGEYPANLRLVAGLDPADRGWQASFLWGYDVMSQRLYMIDSDSTAGGGIQGAYDMLKRWFDKYRCLHWVIEENGFQRAIRRDDRVRLFAAEHGIVLEGHETQGYNKQDPDFGVGAMGRLYGQTVWREERDGSAVELTKVDLPYGDTDAKAKTDVLIGQAKLFAAGVRPAPQVGRGPKMDMLMASWFPQKVIRRWATDFAPEVELDYSPIFADYNMSTMTEVPW